LWYTYHSPSFTILTPHTSMMYKILCVLLLLGSDAYAQQRVTFPAPFPPVTATPQWASDRYRSHLGISFAYDAHDSSWYSPEGNQLVLMRTLQESLGSGASFQFLLPVRYTAFPDSGSFWIRYDPSKFGRKSEERPCFFQAVLFNSNGPGGINAESMQYLHRTLQARNDAAGWYEVKFPYPTSPFWEMPFKMTLVFTLFVESEIDPNLNCAIAVEISDILETYGLITVSAEDVKDVESGGVVLGNPYPNPSRGQVTLPLQNTGFRNLRVRVVDLLGREVALLHDGILSSENLTFNTSNLPAGIYIIHAETGDTITTTQIVVR
jgi:hypothetical protein